MIGGTIMAWTTVMLVLEASMPLVLGQPYARPAREDGIPQAILPAVQYAQKATLQLQAL